jgi:succinate dehydrogenase/fumarate reductase flavoprotein subunit
VPEAHAGEIDRLYSLPLEEFTRERDELAKRLRKDGDADAAAAVKALKKPSVAAWAVNQVQRDRPEEVRELIEVTEELHRVYAKLSSAGARERLEEAAEIQRRLIQSLVRCAKQLLEAGGHGASDETLTKVADTLRAAALDEEVREQVGRGRVVKERRAAGLGPLG